MSVLGETLPAETSGETSILNESSDSEADSNDLKLIQPANVKETQGHNRFTYFAYGSVFLCAALLAYRLGDGIYSSELSQNGERDLDEFTRVLSHHFPNQSSRLWSTLRAALIDKVNMRRASGQQRPSVLLLLPAGDIKNAASTSCDSVVTPSLPSPFAAFVSAVGEHIGATIRAPIKSCATLNLESFDSGLQLYDREEFHLQIGAIHASGYRCIHVMGIDRVPGETAVLLHGLLDFNSSPYKGSVFIITFTRPLPGTPLALQPLASNSERRLRVLEKEVRRYLRSVWEPSLGSEESAALISRITGLIGIYQ